MNLGQEAPVDRGRDLIRNHLRLTRIGQLAGRRVTSSSGPGVRGASNAAHGPPVAMGPALLRRGRHVLQLATGARGTSLQGEFNGDAGTLGV